MSIYAGVKGYLDKLAVADIGRFEGELLRLMRGKHKDVLDAIRTGKQLTPDIEGQAEDHPRRVREELCLMPSLKSFRNRIASVKAIRKITKAQQMVAASKLRRAQEAADAARPYAEKMDAVIANLAAG